MREEVKIEDLPDHVKHKMEKMKFDIIVEMIVESGLQKEFLLYNKSYGAVKNFNEFENMVTKFSEQYPDKFYIVPQLERVEYYFEWKK